MQRSKDVIDFHTVIGGSTLGSWDGRWLLVDRGFTVPQPELRHKIGLFAAKAGGEFKYIGKAANMHGSGLSGGLARAYVKNPSGNSGHGLALLKEHIEDIEAYVIVMPRSLENMKLCVLLNKAMIAVHSPVWNQRKSVVAAARQAAYSNRSMA